MSPEELALAIATGWGGGARRDAKQAREQRRLVLEHAPPSLVAKLAAHGLDVTPRISTAARLERVVRDLATDPAVDGDVLLEAFVDAGATGITLALAMPERAEAVLRSRIRDHYLRLNQLQLSELPDSIATVPDVTTLDLSNNRLRAISPAITRLESLRELYINANEMLSVPEVVFQLHGLHRLSLSDNALESLPDAIGELSELRGLWLSDNPLRELPRGLLRLSKLTFLHLGNLPWSEPSALIAEMTSLEELWLASRSLEHLPAAICTLPKLRRLHLWYSSLRSVPEELFARTDLVELRIKENPLPDETYARLREALPDCVIY
jgi:hypothetical protein